MNSMGYFQTVWFFIWGIIKKSGIYKLLRRIYDAIAGAWNRSGITGLFRRGFFSDEALKKSAAGRVLGSIFTFLGFLQEKSCCRLKERIDDSATVRVCNYYLHNLLALNTRFIGILAAGIGVGLCAAGFATGSYPAFYVYAIIVIGALISIFDVNLTEYLKDSALVKLVSYLTGIEFSFKIFYGAKTAGKKRLFVAAVFGLVAGAAGGILGNPLYTALLICGLFGVFLTLYKVEAGVYFTVFLAPLAPTMVMVGMSVLSLMSLIVKSITTKGFKWKFDGMGFLILGLIVVYIFGVINSFAVFNSLSIWCIYFAFMVFYFVVINTVKTKKQLFDILTIFAISGTLVCLYGIAQYVFGWNVTQAWMDEEMFSDIKMRVYSTLENPNVLGEYILLVLPVSVGLIWAKDKPIQKIICLLMAGVMFVTLILTLSRGCWIGFVLSAAVFVTFAYGKLWGLLLIALPFLPMVLPESIINRILSIGNMEDSSTSYRVYIWLGSLAMMKDFWLSGIGFGSSAFKEVYPFYSYSGIVAPHSHNMFLQILVETGVVGISTFVLVCLYFVKKLAGGFNAYKGSVEDGKPVKKNNKFSIMILAIGAGVIGFLLQGMFDNCFYNYRVFMIFWYVLALGMACVYIAKNTYRNSEAEEGGTEND